MSDGNFNIFNVGVKTEPKPPAPVPRPPETNQPAPRAVEINENVIRLNIEIATDNDMFDSLADMLRVSRERGTYVIVWLDGERNALTAKSMMLLRAIVKARSYCADCTIILIDSAHETILKDDFKIDDGDNVKIIKSDTATAEDSLVVGLAMLSFGHAELPRVACEPPADQADDAQSAEPELGDVAINEIIDTEVDKAVGDWAEFEDELATI
jgi:hypothetical protein